MKYLSKKETKLFLSYKNTFESPQPQLPSRIGPVKSPITRRRHSPIGDIKSSRRQHSLSRDISSVNY